MSKTSAIIGASGEYYVLSQLLRRGWVAALAPDGAPNMDILVTDVESRKLCAIQVKTRRDKGTDKGWHMQKKHETIAADDLFYVFVDLGKGSSDAAVCYIIPSRIVADAIRLSHQAWLATPGQNGRPRRDGNFRRMKPDYTTNIKPITDEGRIVIDRYSLGWLDKYKENWGILGLPNTLN